MLSFTKLGFTSATSKASIGLAKKSSRSQKPSQTFNGRRWNSTAATSEKNGSFRTSTVHEDTTSGENPALAQALKANIQPSASTVKAGEDAQRRGEELKKARTTSAASSSSSTSKKAEKTSPWSV